MRRIYFLSILILFYLFFTRISYSCTEEKNSLLSIYKDKACNVKESNFQSLLYNDNLSGRIVWNEQYFMESFINMYEATKDKRYIEIFVRHADHVLSVRDDAARSLDFMGRMRPGWQTGGYYTLGIPRVIKDIEGIPSLEIRAIHKAGNGNTSIEITEGSGQDFNMVIYNDFRADKRVVQKFDNLHMDIVESLVNESLSPESWIHVKKMGLTPPSPGIYHLEETCRMVLHELHTPLIGIPFLRFAALVFEETELQVYNEKATAYVAAFEESYRDYKSSWREDKDGGYFVFEPGGCYWASGLPVPYNGLSANGRFLLWLYMVTGKMEYLEKSVKLAQKIRAGMKILPDGTLVMPYWYGLPFSGWQDKSTNPVNDIYIKGKAYNGPEDVSHFGLTLQYMVDAYKMGVIFDDNVMIAASNTFLKRIWKLAGEKEEVKWGRDVYNIFLERFEKTGVGYKKKGPKNSGYLAHDITGRGQATNYASWIFTRLGKWNAAIEVKVLKAYYPLFLDFDEIDRDYEYGAFLLGLSMFALQGVSEISSVPLYPFTPRSSSENYIKANRRYHLDESGILYVDYGTSYGEIGKRYNPGFIAVYAQALYKDYFNTNDLRYKKLFFKQIEWLMKNRACRFYNEMPFWAWEYDFDNEKFRARAPWVSAYTNGKIIPVFLKAYEISQDLKYLRAAELSFRAFIVPTKAGGFGTFEKDMAWYEEVAGESAPSSKILNGHISALAGLWTFWKCTGRKDIRQALDLGVSAVKKDLKIYDSGFLSFYSQYPKDPPVFAPAHGYNTLHVHQLLWLHSITDDPVFLSYAIKFAGYDDPGFKFSVAGSTDPKDHGPENLNMEMGNKYWSHNDFPTWIQIDLGSIQEVYGISILGYIAKASPKDYDVLVSLDGKEWATLLSRRGNREQFPTEIFEARKGRYLRIVIMNDNGNRNVALTGIGIHRSKGSPVAVSNWDWFSSGNKPALIFDSGWRVPKGTGWLIADMVHEDIKNTIFEFEGKLVPKISFFGSSGLKTFKPLQFRIMKPDTDKTNFFIDVDQFRYIKLHIEKGVKGGTLRLINGQ
jgi:hypothetical protein